MITLEYDALNGMALPEGMVKPFVTEFIRLNKGQDIKLIFGVSESVPTDRFLCEML